MTSRERFLNACRCAPTDRPPIWLMRQAGRYLPEYRKLKEKHSFTELAQTPELAAEVSLQPMRRFPLDACIVFSDILVIPEALGQPYRFREQGGIEMVYAADTPAAVEKLNPTDIRERLAYVGEALSLLRTELGDSRALLGFGGAPWTLALYMIEGGGGFREFTKARQFIYEQPKAFSNLMEKVTAALIQYFHMQVDSGVDAIQVFDSWAALCPNHLASQISHQYLEQIAAALSPRVPLILYSRGGCSSFSTLAKLPFSVMSLDWTWDLTRFRNEVCSDKAIQGNLDPVALCADPTVAANHAGQLLDKMRGVAGYIFNLGHGMVPQARIDCVEAVCEQVVRQQA